MSGDIAEAVRSKAKASPAWLNLGGSLAGSFFAAVAAWMAMNDRLTKVETQQLQQVEIVKEIRIDIRDNIREIKADVKEANASVRALESRVARKGF